MKRGDTIGPYEIVQRLGGQKWAHVFSATRSMGGPRSAGVALKVPNLEGDADAIEVFKMKAEIATFASHPNLVRTIEVGESGNVPFMVMELLDGIHLSSLLARGLPIHGGVAASIARAIAEALHHLHSLTDGDGRHLGIVHLEVNANHVVLTPEGGVKLVDYGAMIERLHATRPPEPNYDVNCLGALLADMVRETADQYLYKIIARATAPRIDDRFSSAREMADALSVHLLTYPGFRPELAIRQMMSTLDQHPLADPSLGGPDPFATDTRARTLDLGPPAKPMIWGSILWGMLAVMVMGVCGFLIYRFWPF